MTVLSLIFWETASLEQLHISVYWKRDKNVKSKAIQETQKMKRKDNVGKAVSKDHPKN